MSSSLQSSSPPSSPSSRTTRRHSNYEEDEDSGTIRPALPRRRVPNNNEEPSIVAAPPLLPPPLPSLRPPPRVPSDPVSSNHSEPSLRTQQQEDSDTATTTTTTQRNKESHQEFHPDNDTMEDDELLRIKRTQQIVDAYAQSNPELQTNGNNSPELHHDDMKNSGRNDEETEEEMPHEDNVKHRQVDPKQVAGAAPSMQPDATSRPNESLPGTSAHRGARRGRSRFYRSRPGAVAVTGIDASSTDDDDDNLGDNQALEAFIAPEYPQALPVSAPVDAVVIRDNRDLDGTTLTSYNDTYPGHTGRRPPKKWMWVSGIIILLLVLILGITLGLLLPYEPTEQTISLTTPPTPVVTPSPTFLRVTPSPTTDSPTQSPTPSSRLETLLQRLAPLSNETLMREVPTSPQYRAVRWLAFDDAAGLDEVLTPFSLLQERYALAVFYYSTGGETWTIRHTFLSNETVCVWTGVGCATAVRVTDLELSTAGLRGSLPSELQHLPALESLALVQNALTGTLPTELGQLESLVGIYLFENALTGPIPSNWGPSLELVSLRDNLLTGTIPTEFGENPNLRRLWLFNNQLNGTIPSELGNIRGLERFEVLNCQMTGPLPTELGNLAFLDNLRLYNNRFTGTIPSEFGNMISMESMDLSTNLLTGTVPMELGNLVNLVNLYLSTNELTGNLTEVFCGNSYLIDDFWADCGGREPEVECACCTTCI